MRGIEPEDLLFRGLDLLVARTFNIVAIVLNKELKGGDKYDSQWLLPFRDFFYL